MRSRILIGLLVVAVALAAGLYLLRDRLFSGVGDNPYVQPALPSGYRPHVRIDIPGQPPGDFKQVVVPGGPSPFVLARTELWNVSTRTRVATVQYAVGPAAAQALSADGQYFAYEKDGVVNVLELAGGQNVLQIPYEKAQGNLDFVEFAGPGELVVAARAFAPPDPKKPNPSSTNAVEIWDVARHNKVHSVRVPSFNQTGAAISPDGKQLAIMGTDHLRIYELQTGKTLTRWQAPPGKYKVLLSATGVRFSPDGREVAAYLGMGMENSVLCWDAATCRLLGEHRFPALTGVGNGGPALQWLPDGNGWLVGGRALVHRASGRIVWLLRTRAPFVHVVSVLDDNHLLAPVYEWEKHALVSVPIPWAEINAALKAEASKEAAPLRPGQSVSLQVDVGELHLGNEQQARGELTRALTARLAADGIAVAERQPTVVYARFKEAPGRTLKVFSMGFASQQQGGAREAQETQMALEVGMQSGDSPEPLWRTYVSRGAGLIVSGQGTTSDLHKDTFEALQLDIRRLPWPYFIPASKETARLPIVSQL